ncbi:MAG: beta-lactamase family protein [Oscillospiraceae bacterium]|nr:beta-lactamase family protein [Oscillospiraceae bacterium]
MQDKIYSAIKSSVDSGSTSGVNVLILKDGKEEAYCQYGYRDLENKTPMSRDTIFRLYSQTKPVTAAAAMLLVSQGKIDLSSWLSDYMPEFEKSYINVSGERVPAQKHITVRDLLNMTSGLPYPGDWNESVKQSGEVFWKMEQRLYSDDPVSTAEFAKMMSEVDLCFEPGSEFMYGTSADILGALIERVSGMTFREFLMKSFFEPLEMNDTDFYVPAEKSDRLAKVYDYSDSGLCEVKTDHLGLRYYRDVPPAFESGGAGLCSTLDDYAKFASMLLGGGEYKGRRIMPYQAVKYMTSSCTAEAQSAQLRECWTWMGGYSYGNLMRICTDESQTSVFSSKGEYGWDGWLGTFFSNEPEHGITMLLGAQQVGIGRVGTLTREIKNIVMSELI